MLVKGSPMHEIAHDPGPSWISVVQTCVGHSLSIKSTRIVPRHWFHFHNSCWVVILVLFKVLAEDWAFKVPMFCMKVTCISILYINRYGEASILYILYDYSRTLEARNEKRARRVASLYIRTTHNDALSCRRRQGIEKVCGVLPFVFCSVKVFEMRHACRVLSIY